MEYPLYVFIETIESIQGITHLRTDSRDGFEIRVYQGFTGKAVFIDMSEESITSDTGCGHLKKLGVAHLIPALFPDSKEFAN